MTSSQLSITRSTAPLLSVFPAPAGMVLVTCACCGAGHHNGPEVDLPLCRECFDDYLRGDER